jgi:very-short-patch-repair endonuclease
VDITPTVRSIASRQHGLVTRAQLAVLGFELDFAFPAERVDVECDGWEAHGRKRAQFEEDRRRDAALSAAGWVVLRLTWLQITRRPAWVATSIQRTLAVRAAA